MVKRKKRSYTADMMHLSDSRDCNAAGDCGKRLDKLYPCNIALISRMDLSEHCELSVRLIAFSYIAGVLVFLPFVTGAGSITIPTAPNICVIPLYSPGFRTIYLRKVSPTNTNLILIHLHSHPLFHVIDHLCIGLDIDAHIFLIHGDHDGVWSAGRIAGTVVIDFVGPVGVEAGRSFRRDDLSSLYIQRSQPFALCLVIDRIDLEVVVQDDIFVLHIEFWEYEIICDDCQDNCDHKWQKADKRHTQHCDCGDQDDDEYPERQIVRFRSAGDKLFI